MPMLSRAAAVERQDRIAASFMVVHLLVQLGIGLALFALNAGLGFLFLGATGALFLGGLGLIAGLFSLAQAILAAVAAWGLWHGRSWRMPAAIIASFFAMSHFPLGTGFALGTLFYAYKSHKGERADAGV